MKTLIETEPMLGLHLWSENKCWIVEVVTDAKGQNIRFDFGQKRSEAVNLFATLRKSFWIPTISTRNN